MRNQEVATIFRDIASILEIKRENPFRIRAYEKAALNIESLTGDIASIAERKELEKIPGVGKDLAGKIEEILNTGTCSHLEELKKEIPAGLIEMLAVPGLGPKTAKLFYDKVKIASVDELEEMARSHKLHGLPGIKEKTEENILKGIELLRQGRERSLLGTILPLVNEIKERLKILPEVKQISEAGSVRRKKETIRDIDILVISSDFQKVMKVFTTMPVAGDILAKGPTKSSIRTRQGIQVDLRVVEPESFGAALCYFTGSKAHNIRIREMGVKLGLKINEYGVFRGEKKIGGKTEKEVYQAVGLPYIPPELREDRGEIEAALAGNLPRLVELKDIRGDFHVHSSYSDGSSAFEEIAEKAKSIGLEWVGVCDHSQSLKIAGGVSIEDLKKKIKEIREFNERGRSVKLLCGTEGDIGNDGKLDYPDDILAELDLVVAAIHTGFKQDEKTITRRIVTAMQHPLVNMIAHPTGRLFGEREPYAVNMEKVMEEAKNTGTAIEINAYPKRLDLNDIYVKAAKERGIKLGIGTDTHILDQMEYIDLGLAVARRGWLEKDDLLNTLTYEKLMKVLKGKR
ncbi:MAG TPA: DNA polymerase/3'-5' exonuclease PolX [Thermodesulfobacteriota bacterium]|nr:DNA polymerase/3'-5' exonuclease PolX [Thermodesulfobacteriota bacterium]